MMQRTTIKLRKAKVGKSPIAIVGMPGIGNVGKLVAEHLRRELKAVRIGTIYSPHFPHQAVMMKSGRLRLVSNTIYLAKAKGKPDMIIITGDVQAVTPEGQYEVNSMIFRLLKERFGCGFIYTIGGYTTGEGMPSEEEGVRQRHQQGHGIQVQGHRHNIRQVEGAHMGIGRAHPGVR